MSVLFRSMVSVSLTVYRNLSPGGFIELMDPIYPVTSDDETVSEDSAVYKWSSLMNEAATKMGSGLDSGIRYRELLIEAGFVNVVETPYRWPMNTWPKDKKTRELGIVSSYLNISPQTNGNQELGAM